MNSDLECPGRSSRAVTQTTGCGAARCPSEDVLCVHFDADGRSYSMRPIDPRLPPALSPFDLWAHWHAAGDGIWWGRLLNGRRPLLDGILLTTSDAGRSLRPRGRLADVIKGIRHRPLLLTFSHGGDLAPAKVTPTQQILVRAAVDHAGSWEQLLSPAPSRDARTSPSGCAGAGIHSVLGVATPA